MRVVRRLGYIQWASAEQEASKRVVMPRLDFRTQNRCLWQAQKRDTEGGWDATLGGNSNLIATVVDSPRT